jgi:hypothetical protein
VGCGTLGSNFLLTLLKEYKIPKIINNIYICDHDNIENHNPLYNTLPNKYTKFNKKAIAFSSYLSDEYRSINFIPIINKYPDDNIDDDSLFTIDCRDTFTCEKDNVKIKANYDGIYSIIQVNPKSIISMNDNKNYNMVYNDEIVKNTIKKMIITYKNYNNKYNDKNLYYQCFNKKIIKKELNNEEEDISLIDKNISIKPLISKLLKRKSVTLNDLFNEKYQIKTVEEFVNCINSNKQKINDNHLLSLSVMEDEINNEYIIDLKLTIESA